MIAFIVFSQNVFANNYTQVEIESITSELQALPKWEKYIQTLDLFSKKYENNELKAKKIKSNISKVLNKYNDSNHNDIQLVLLILKYLDIQFENIVDSYDNQDDMESPNEDNTQDTTTENDNKQDESENIEYSKEALYPWFSTFYEDDTPKTILAGKESFIYNGWLVANIEEIEVEKMEFTLQASDLSDFKYSFKEAILYVEWHKAQTITSNRFSLTNSTQWILEFDSIDGVFVPKEEIEFRLALVPQEIWYEKLGKFIPEITVSKASVTQWKWVISGANITMKTLSDGAEKFQISPVVLSVGVVDSLNNSSRASFNIQIDAGKNTQKTSASELKARIDTIKIMYLESYGSATFKLYNSDNRSNGVIGVKNGWFLEFDLSWIWTDRYVSKWSWETFDIQVSAPIDSNISLDLINQWIIYSVEWLDNANNININLLDSISLGNRKY